MAKGVDRRTLFRMGGAAALAGASLRAGLLSGPAGGIAATASGPAVTTVHLDQPWHDFTGAAEPYLPPVGARGGDHAGGLDETDWRRLGYSV